MTADTKINAAALREEVKKKYREVAIEPLGEYHFHTGRPLAKRLELYPKHALDIIP